MKDLTQTQRWAGENPCSPEHPHQLWLAASPGNWAANQAAFLAACPELSDEMLVAVCQLHDSAQHHFITRLIFNQGEVYDSPEAAYASAYAHHVAIVNSA